MCAFVSGVQTCALPIYRAGSTHSVRSVTIFPDAIRASVWLLLAMMLSAGAVTSNSASSSRPAVRLLPNPLLPFAIIHLPSFSSRASQVATWQLVLNSARHELTDNPLTDQPATTTPPIEIGRASCRDRECQYGEHSG